MRMDYWCRTLGGCLFSNALHLSLALRQGELLIGSAAKSSLKRWSTGLGWPPGAERSTNFDVSTTQSVLPVPHYLINPPPLGTTRDDEAS